MKCNYLKSFSVCLLLSFFFLSCISTVPWNSEVVIQDKENRKGIKVLPLPLSHGVIF